MKFKFLSGDIDWVSFGGKFVSERLDSGLFHYWLVLDFLNLEEAGAQDDDDDYTYHAAIQAISLDLLGFDKIDEMLSGMNHEWLQEWYYRQTESNRVLLLIEEASTYGYYAPCGYFEGDDWKRTIVDAKKKAAHVATYPWSYWGEIANGLGSTAYDFMTGDPMAALQGESLLNSLEESYGLAYRNIQRVMGQRERVD